MLQHTHTTPPASLGSSALVGALGTRWTGGRLAAQLARLLACRALPPLNAGQSCSCVNFTQQRPTVLAHRSVTGDAGEQQAACAVQRAPPPRSPRAAATAATALPQRSVVPLDRTGVGQRQVRPVGQPPLQVHDLLQPRIRQLLGRERTAPPCGGAHGGWGCGGGRAGHLEAVLHGSTPPAAHAAQRRQPMRRPSGIHHAPWAQVQSSGLSSPTCSLTCGIELRLGERVRGVVLAPLAAAAAAGAP